MLDSDAHSLVPRLRDVLATQLGIELPPDNDNLFASGLIDSLTLVELLFEVEHEFGVNIELESFNFERAGTLEDFAAWVHSLGARA